jgi:hypothetical protein
MMRRLLQALLLLLCVTQTQAGLISISGGRGGPADEEDDELLVAFPGAEGFGAYATGGRDGTLCRVTNTNSTGAGSFHACLTATSARIITFATSGVIDLNQDLLLGAAHSNVTILGQTSPGGITIKGGQIEFYYPSLGAFNNGIFRYLRFRRQPSEGGEDTLAFNGAHNVIVDHSDFSGGADESFDFTVGYNFTLQWSTIANSVQEAGNDKYGFLLAYRPTTGITLHHNLHANHNRRCATEMHWSPDGDAPDTVPATGAELDFRNNVIYNCVFQNLYRGDPVINVLGVPTNTIPEGLDLNLVGNYGKVGPDSTGSPRMVGGFDGSNGDMHVSDNTYEGGSINLTSEVAEHNFSDDVNVTTTSAAQAYEDVLECVGSWPRDAMNTRTIDDVINDTGSLGDVTDALDTDTPAVPTDTDSDGIPDTWETANGRNPNSADSMQLHSNGYTWVEVYANELAAEYQSTCAGDPAWFAALSSLTYTQPASNKLADVVDPKCANGQVNAGSTHCAAILQAESGFGNDAGIGWLIAFGNGGHQDTYDNAIYGICYWCNPLQWTRLMDASSNPSPGTPPAGYWWSSHNYWDVTGWMGRWIRGHTNSAGDNGFSDQGRTWEYNAGTSPTLNGGTRIDRGNTLGVIDGVSQGATVYDPENDQILFVGGDSGTSVRRYTLGASGLTHVDNCSCTNNQFFYRTFAAIDTTNHILLARRPGSGGGSDPGNTFYSISLDGSMSTTWQTVTPTGFSISTDNPDFVGWGWHPPSNAWLTWDPDSGDILKMTMTVDGTNRYSAGTITTVDVAGTKPVHDTGQGGVLSKVQLVEMQSGEYAMILVPEAYNTTAKDIHVIRIPGAL